MLLECIKSNDQRADVLMKPKNRNIFVDHAVVSNEAMNSRLEEALQNCDAGIVREGSFFLVSCVP